MNGLFVEFGQKPSQLFSCKDYLANCLVTDDTYVYRGQGDHKWDLIPSLFRKDDGSLISYNERRRRISYFSSDDFTSDFDRLRHSSSEAAGLELKKNNFKKMQKMVFFQHFGIETPLLDWTISPLIALFMAFVFRPRGGKRMRVFRLNRMKIPQGDLIFETYEKFKFDRIRKQLGGVTAFGQLDNSGNINLNSATFLEYLINNPNPGLLEFMDVKILKDEVKLVSDALKTNGFTYDGMFPNSPYWLSRAIQSGLPWR